MLHGIDVTWKKSTHSCMVVIGDMFLVSVNLNEKEDRSQIIKITSICSGDIGVSELEEVADNNYYEEDGNDNVGEDNDDWAEEGDNSGNQWCAHILPWIVLYHSSRMLFL